MESNAELCRAQGWNAGDVLCRAGDVLEEGERFVRLTAIGEVQVLGRPLARDGIEGDEEMLSLVPYRWRPITLREWQSLQDTRVI